jgi:alkanesulfonate monooxygenase SsuD/methylene tetrahydromethanopterin reductase-like flavin-dependent oxidoreductase (luciferase family)
MEEEFRALGRPFRGRGARMDEMLEVIGKLLAGGPVEHRGKHFDFGPLELSPVPARPVPIWIGGHSAAALRRAPRADGWVGANLPEPAIEPLLARLAQARRDIGRETGDFAFALATRASPRPCSVGASQRSESAGSSSRRGPRAAEEPSSLDQKLEGMRRFGREVICALA